jgi:hypothetical protein
MLFEEVGIAANALLNTSLLTNDNRIRRCPTRSLPATLCAPAAAEEYMENKILGLDQLLHHYLTTGKMLTGVS